MIFILSYSHIVKTLSLCGYQVNSEQDVVSIGTQDSLQQMVGVLERLDRVPCVLSWPTK